MNEIAIVVLEQEQLIKACNLADLDIPQECSNCHRVKYDTGLRSNDLLLCEDCFFV